MGHRTELGGWLNGDEPVEGRIVDIVRAAYTGVLHVPPELVRMVTGGDVLKDAG